MASVRIDLPAVEDLIPAVREKLRDIHLLCTVTRIEKNCLRNGSTNAVNSACNRQQHNRNAQEDGCLTFEHPPVLSHEWEK